MNPNIESKIQSLLCKKRHGDQIVLGIAGGSGCGKSTISKAIASKLGASSIQVKCIGLDRFFLPINEMPKYYSHYLDKKEPNFNRPDSIDFDSMIDFCRNLTEFDFVILEGHFALYRQEIRDLMDIKCFIAIDVEEMLSRRTVRNLEANYGGDKENILNYNKECVLPMYNEHILPTKKYADLLIPNSTSDANEKEIIIELLCKKILITNRCTGH